MGLEANLIQRYIAANTVTTAYALSMGWQAATPHDATLHPIILAGSSADGKRNLGAEVQFFGVGAENTTCAYRISTVHKTRDGTQFQLRPYCSGIFTLGTGATAIGPTGAVSPSIVREADVFADTITVTNAWGDAVAGANGSSGAVAYSPADNTPGVLKLGDLGDALGIIIEFDINSGGGSGVTSANALVEFMS